MGLLTLLSAGILSTIGLGSIPVPGGPPEGVPIERWLGPTTVLYTYLSQIWAPLAYVLSAMGWGRLPARWIAGGSINRHWIQIGLGLAILLTLSHALGMLGWLSGDGLWPRVIGWSAVAIGLVLLADQVARRSLRPEYWPVVPWTAALWAMPLGVLLVAAANPPGGLWNTEFGSFDALSYHLQLPKEWAAGSGDHGPRLWPSAHNVYSYLPSYMEAAFLHLGAMQMGDEVVLRRLLGPDAYWPVACQMLHALLGIIGALLIGRCAFVASVQTGVERAAAAHVGAAAGALALAVPWMTVVSSLAYNDGAMVALGAGALLCAMETTLGPKRRAIACAVLVGAATGCKPTALLMFTPLVGIVMLVHTPRRAWAASGVIGAIVGVAMLAPWLTRNALASGNPVFPFASGLLGAGHWTQEQAARHALHHGADPALGWGERLARLFLERGGEHFGLSHPQWALVGFAGLALGCFALARRPGRGLALCMFAGVAAMACVWMTMTHMQSRFLLPMLVPLVVLLALGLGSLRSLTAARPGVAVGRGGRVAGPLALGVAALAVGVFGSLRFVAQAGGEPNLLLVRGPSVLSGMSVETGFMELSEAEQVDFARAQLGPEGFINLIIRPHEPPAVLSLGNERKPGVYLLGDTAPLYFLGALGTAPASLRTPDDHRAPVVYHTTWDASPLGDAVRAAPDDPAAWTGRIRSLGVGYVLVNYDELSRLITRSKYYDPAVTIEVVQRWLTDPQSGLKPVKAWERSRPGTGRALFRFVNVEPAHPALR